VLPRLASNSWDQVTLLSQPSEHLVLQDVFLCPAWRGLYGDMLSIEFKLETNLKTRIHPFSKLLFSCLSLKQSTASLGTSTLLVLPIPFLVTIV
jgi:hypothetical protein